MSLEKSSAIQTYAGLLKRVREAIAGGKERALEAVERESVRTKWEVGKLIHEHVLLHKDRADYGKRVLKRLSGDLTISEAELYYMVEFARTYPIFPAPGKLSWAHVRELLAVNEPEQREEIAKQAVRKKWASKQLRDEIRKLKSAKQITVSRLPREELLVPIKGKLDTYRIITAKAGPWTGQTALDMGFANYHLPPGSLQRFQDRDIVEIASSPRKKTPGLLAMTVAKDATEKDLFTYRAYLLEVTDGDTLWVIIDLGFGFVTQQQLRLRGIDCPEITSRAGQKAKRFVERELENVSSLVITSTKSDKYDRYLADIFYETKHGERFLNNLLLEHELAVRVTA